MARAGTAEFRHHMEHFLPVKHNMFWSEGVYREAYVHPYHAWKLNHVPVPTYAGINTTSNDFYTKTWALKATNKGEDSLPWAGKSAFHSPRFHGTKNCKMKCPSMSDLMGWQTEPPPRTPLPSEAPLSTRSTARRNSKAPPPSSRHPAEGAARPHVSIARSHSTPTIRSNRSK
eukprot:GEMP01103293.1.p1 GENE.GEMP01103293.1~~GEMP01103293.1.p1  ORF type:complete len:173 (+),score=33.66 GEMP01103293.1:152-670(+)